MYKNFVLCVQITSLYVYYVCRYCFKSLRYCVLFTPHYNTVNWMLYYPCFTDEVVDKLAEGVKQSMILRQHKMYIVVTWMAETTA